jgi:hypothetical protein
VKTAGLGKASSLLEVLRVKRRMVAAAFARFLVVGMTTEGRNIVISYLDLVYSDYV